VEEVALQALLVSAVFSAATVCALELLVYEALSHSLSGLREEAQRSAEEVRAPDTRLMRVGCALYLRGGTLSPLSHLSHALGLYISHVVKTDAET
jgi:hypothetical protein